MVGVKNIYQKQDIKLFNNIKIRNKYNNFIAVVNTT